MLGVFRYHRARIIGLIAGPGVCPLGAVGKGKRLLGDEPAGVRAKSSVLINIAHASGAGVDGMRCPLDNSIEEIPAQCVWGAIPKGIVGWYGQVKLPKEAALIISRSEHLWSRHLKGRNLGICQIIADDRTKHIRTKWETSLEKDGTAWGTFGHRPCISKTHSRARDSVDVWSPGWIYGWNFSSSVSKDLHLINSDIVHNNKQNVRWAVQSVGGRTGMCTVN